MIALRLRTRVLYPALAAALLAAAPASASTATIDPELEKQEREVERLLKSAEAEFWSLKQRLERDRNDRERRLALARAEYEKAQQVTNESSDDNVAEHKADVALAKYQTELELALSGVETARTALDRVEARVSQYRAALDALRRRHKGAGQKPACAPADSTARTPITDASRSMHSLRS